MDSSLKCNVIKIELSDGGVVYDYGPMILEGDWPVVASFEFLSQYGYEYLGMSRYAVPEVGDVYHLHPYHLRVVRVDARRNIAILIPDTIQWRLMWLIAGWRYDAI